MAIVVNSLCWFPKRHFGARELASVKSSLSIVPAFSEPGTKPIITYKERTNTIGLPVRYGIDLAKKKKLFNQVRFDLCEGQPIRVTQFPDPHHEKAAPGQAEFMADMLRKLKKRGIATGKAPTGSGKTVTCLNTIGKLGRTALVIVPSKALADQWRDEIKLHLGIPDNRIGYVEEGKALWRKKWIVIAVIHNLVDRAWSPEFFQHFGFVCWDEGHRLGARSFSKTVKLFPAKYRLCLTATPKRRDGCAGLFLNYFGDPCIVATAEALECDALVTTYMRPSRRPYDPGIPRSVLINIISKSAHRNIFCAKWIYKMWKKGRRGILVIGDRIEQLQILMAVLYDMGVPDEEMGMFTRSWIDPDGRKRLFTQADLKRVKKHCKIIFATYNMMKEGVDIPRLDSGIDVTPRTEGEQVIGRIRRILAGKLRPLWITILDILIPMFHKSCLKRVHEYRRCNVNVQYLKGKRKHGKA